MKRFLFLPLMPESLVASHLAPIDFGSYLATGSAKRTRGPAIYLTLSDAYAEKRLNELGVAADLGRPRGDTPRRSLYLAIYRVLETVPLDAMEALNLVTDDGRVLTLTPAPYQKASDAQFHLYQEFCPVTPRVVSELDPQAFGAYITNPQQHVSVPAMVFAELTLGSLAADAEAKDVHNLPYPNLDHLRDCLRELRAKQGKQTKTVIRYLNHDVLFRTLQSGFYVAAAGGAFRYFPMPSHDELETAHFPWWRSAQRSFGG